MTTAVIDADTIVYASAFAFEKAGGTSVAGGIHYLHDGIKWCVEGLLRDTKADEAHLFLTGEGNFRFDVFPAYKSNRAEAPRPVYKQDAIDYLVSEFNAQVVDGMEADDACGIAMYELGDEGILVFQDKDLLTIKGWHFDWHRLRRPNGAFYVTELEALRYFYKQLLKGDATDSIPGVFQMTGQKATKGLLGAIDSMTCEHEMYNYVVKTYGSQKAVDKLSQLIWIRREEGVGYVPPHFRK